MSFPKIDPSMLNNINPEQMKMASDMLSGMSDEQLRNYGKMMGMGDIDPSMLRNSAGMMKNMDRHQFETMKNTAKQHYGTNNNATTPTSGNTQSSQPSSSSGSVSRYSNIEALKLKGNNLFKKQSYDEAASAYFEAIIDIEDIRSKSVNDSELDALEVSCRLNYANVKAKLNEYDTVMIQAKAVLKIQENGKAYFRLGQALNHFKKYEDAQKNLEKAVDLLPNDSTVTELLQEVKSHIKVEEPKETIPEGKETSEPEPKEEVKAKTMKKKHAPDVEAPITKDEPKASKVEAPFDYIGSKKAEEKETVIEEEKIPERKPVHTHRPGGDCCAPKEEIKTGFGNIGADQVKKSQDELSKMNADQLKTMTETFKNMDNNMLRSILKQQSGMDLTDEQLTKMKAMMTPEMLSGFSKMNTANLPKAPAQQGTAPTFPQNRATARPTQPGQPTADPNQPLLGDLPGFPGSNSMDLGSEQVQNMMEMVIQNPEMLKSLVAMLGENHPIAKMLQNKTPEQLAKYMRVLQKLLKFYGKISPLVKILRDWWQLLAGLLIAYVIYRMTQ